MNIFSALFAKLFSRKKPEPEPKLYVQQFGRSVRGNDMRVGKSQGAPSQRTTESTPFSRQGDDIMSNPLHPLNPISPINIYSDPTPSHSSHSYDCGSSSSSSYDSGSSSSDSGSSSSSCD